jgi:hypothetical protein
MDCYNIDIFGSDVRKFPFVMAAVSAVHCLCYALSSIIYIFRFWNERLHSTYVASKVASSSFGQCSFANFIAWEAIPVGLSNRHHPGPDNGS